MNRRGLFLLTVLLSLTNLPLRAGDAFPLFRWDHVPVYAHVGKRSGDFTPKELDFLAKHFDFITIEKAQAIQKYGNTEAGFAVAVREIKKRNPKAKVLFYWNASLAYFGMYEAMRTFPTNGLLRDNKGKLVLRRHKIPNYDLTRQDVRDWWSDIAAKAVHEYGADGIFADAMGQRKDGLDDKKVAALVAARIALLKETRRKIGPDKLIIYNGLMKDDPEKLLQFADGAMIESFCHPKYGMSKEVLVSYFEATRAAARKGKIVILKGWPGFTFRWHEMMEKTPYTELARLARKRIFFPLACFLIAAEPYCYFCYSWGYREKHGTFEWYPEFDKPLGPPLGEAKRDGWTYHRDFAHASVHVNLETKTAQIHWK